jgi:hypothetical protein
MKFIELTHDETKQKILINVSHIVKIIDYEGYRRIQMLNEWTTVLETMEQIKSILSPFTLNN